MNRQRAWSGIPLLLILAAAWSPGRRLPSEPVTLAGPLDCLHCWDAPPGCPTGEHVASPDEHHYNERGAGSHETCYTGTCAANHPPCDDGFASRYPALKLAVLSGDDEAVARLLKEFGTKATINLTRSAIQVYGCSGQIAAHLTLPKSELEHISALVE